MTCFNKDEYKTLKRAAKNAGDTHVYSAEYGIDWNPEYVGVSVAFQPGIENTNGKMLNVAVSYCSSEDNFKPKHGKYQALLKLANGEYVQVPMAQFLRNNGANATADQLLAAFAV